MPSTSTWSFLSWSFVVQRVRNTYNKISLIWYVYMHPQSLQSCPTLCNTMDCSLPGSYVHWTLQVRMLEWVVMPSSRTSSQPRDQTQVSHIAGRLFTVWAPGNSKKTGMDSLFLLQGNFQPRNRTEVFCIEGRFFTTWATQEAPGICIHPQFVVKKKSNDHRMRSGSFSTVRWIWVRISFMIPL